MLTFSLMEPEGILRMQPHGPLTQADFERLRGAVDAYLATHAGLHGVLVHAPEFPGWENWASLSAHLHFVRNHHQQVQRIALVTDSVAADLAQWFGRHFTAAEVRHFPYAQETQALQWLQRP